MEKIYMARKNKGFLYKYNAIVNENYHKMLTDMFISCRETYKHHNIKAITLTTNLNIFKMFKLKTEARGAFEDLCKFLEDVLLKLEQFL